MPASFEFLIDVGLAGRGRAVQRMGMIGMARLTISPTRPQLAADPSPTTLALALSTRAKYGVAGTLKASQASDDISVVTVPGGQAGDVPGAFFPGILRHHDGAGAREVEIGRQPLPEGLAGGAGRRQKSQERVAARPGEGDRGRAPFGSGSGQVGERRRSESASPGRGNEGLGRVLAAPEGVELAQDLGVAAQEAGHQNDQKTDDDGFDDDESFHQAPCRER